MLVNGTARLMVDISAQEALNALCKELKLGYKDLELLEDSHPHNKTGKPALYFVEDTSYHSSPIYEYNLYSCDTNLIECYKALKTIEKTLRENGKVGK